MKSKLSQIANALVCSVIAFTICGCAPSSEESRSAGSNQQVAPLSDEQNAGMQADLLTAEQIASFSGAFFLPEGEDRFRELVQTPMGNLVEMYQGEAVDRASSPDYLYDGVGDLREEEGVEERRFLSLYRGTEEDVLVLDRSLNSQIMVTDEKCEVYQVDFRRYWSGNLFEYNGYYTEMGGVEADGIDDIFSSEKGYFSQDTLNGILSSAGITIQTYAEDAYVQNGAFSDRRIDTVDIWSSETKTSLPVGRFEGTTWEEGTIGFETPYYVVFPEPVLTPAPTKLGYFICDFSSVDPGLYLLMNGEEISGQIIEVI